MSATECLARKKQPLRFLYSFSSRRLCKNTIQFWRRIGLRILRSHRWMYVSNYNISNMFSCVMEHGFGAAFFSQSQVHKIRLVVPQVAFVPFPLASSFDATSLLQYTGNVANDMGIHSIQCWGWGGVGWGNSVHVELRLLRVLPCDARIMYWIFFTFSPYHFCSCIAKFQTNATFFQIYSFKLHVSNFIMLLYLKMKTLTIIDLWYWFC